MVRVTRPMSSWRIVLWFGVISLTADMVYEGARSMYGPLLASLGASGLVVGVVTGLGEAMALVLRLVFGPLADRTGRYWLLTISGYALTVVCVPLLAVAPFLGGAGLAVAALLILLERSGKAIRSPSKSALLAHAAGALGRGRGFGVQKAMDQVGAFAGPLVVAAVVAATGVIWPGMLVLAVPGVVAIAVLLVLRARVPDLGAVTGTPDAAHPPASDDPGSEPSGIRTRGAVRAWLADAFGSHLPGDFFRFAVAASLTTGGLVTFGIIGYHLTADAVVPLATVPLVYAAAMAVGAVSALLVGWVYDRAGAHVLLVVPVLVAAVPPLALTQSFGLVLAGVVVWGLALGIQDSAVKALVAELVPAGRRATAYGVFAGIQGAFAVIGGAGIGWLYDVSLPALVVTVAATQLLALGLLWRTVRPGAGPHRRARLHPGA
ncbi:MFS transporter [Intrasporangium calvum]|uniref:MFS transporter n=1 Tax=Intrasporangium calvum TaxID=53358 RepID=UPI000DF5D81F|nr:MFS transporter [Intrasporangium calvum]AXG14853.1 MFS transporter [Intrasporangium calvum]